MKNTNNPHMKANAELAWKQIEDHLGPRLRLTVIDRIVYYHLLRHSRLEGKMRVRFSIFELGRRVRLSRGPVREAVRRLAEFGVLRLIDRSGAGHFVEVRLPEEVRRGRIDAEDPGRVSGINLETADFLKRRALRRAIHAREAGSCFYCMRRLRSSARCLDHVTPRARFGRNSYRNLVSCCQECNAKKSHRSAHDFLRWLYREQRLTVGELKRRLRALEALAAGKLRPRLL